MKRIFLHLTLIIGLLSATFLAPLSYAHAATGSIDAVCEGVTGVGGGCNQQEASRVGKTIKTALRIMQVIAGLLAVFYLISAGLKFITSSGSSEGVKSARNTILYTAIGIIIVLLSEAIIRFVLDRFN